MNSKQDKKLKLGVMGFPVRQSRSPELFYKTFAGRADVLNRFSYDLLEEPTFEKAFERFQQDYYAVNVTIPYKEPAFKAADEVSPQCRAIGAANLLIHQDGRIIAHNTDVLAVTEILKRWSREQNDLNYSPKVPNGGSREQNDLNYSPEVPNGGSREQNDLNYSPKVPNEGSREQNGLNYSPEVPNEGSREQNGLNYSPEVPNEGSREQNDLNYSPKVPNEGSREQNGLNYSPGLKVMVVGCGGAGKAAVAAALSVGASVTIVNRTADTAIRFINHFQTPNSRPDSSSTENSSSTPKHSPKHSSQYITKSPSLPSVRSAPLSSLPTEVRRADFIIYTLPIAVPELRECNFTGKTVLEAKYYDPSIKQIPGMTYIPGTEWLHLQALATYRILGLDIQTPLSYGLLRAGV